MNYITTIEAFNKLSPSIQGGLWPLCKTCSHIAQSHDTHKSQPKENSCNEPKFGQCGECGTWTNKTKCKCTGYDGPKDTIELVELLKLRATL